MTETADTDNTDSLSGTTSVVVQGRENGDTCNEL